MFHFIANYELITTLIPPTKVTVHTNHWINFTASHFVSRFAFLVITEKITSISAFDNIDTIRGRCKKQKLFLAHWSLSWTFFRVLGLGLGFWVQGFGFCEMLVFLKSMTMLKRGLRTL